MGLALSFLRAVPTGMPPSRGFRKGGAPKVAFTAFPVKAAPSLSPGEFVASRLGSQDPNLLSQSTHLTATYTHSTFHLQASQAFNNLGPSDEGEQQSILCPEGLSPRQGAATGLPGGTSWALALSQVGSHVSTIPQ